MRLTEFIFGWQGAVIAQFILTWLVIYLIFMRPRRKARRADSRYYNRYESRFKGWLVSNGQRRKIRGIDLNNSGALIASRVPLAPGDCVFVYIESARLMGSAEVRHCVRGRMFGYNVGVAFRGPLMRATEGVWQFHQVRGTEADAFAVDLAVKQ